MDFFKKYQKQIVWCANTRIGRWYFTYDSAVKAEKFYEIYPSSAVIDIRAIKRGKKYRIEKTGIFYSCNYFEKKLSYILFWKPYWKGFIENEKIVFKPVYVLPCLAFFAKFPFLFLTVTDFNSTTGANSPMDVRYSRDGAGETSFNTGHDAASALANDNATGATNYVGAQRNSGTPDYFAFYRDMCNFATGDTINGGTVTAATFKASVNSSQDVINEAQSYAVLGHYTGSASTVQNGDYSLMDGMTASITENSDRIDYTGIGTGVKTWTLNATGTGNVSTVVGGISGFALVGGHDSQRVAESAAGGNNINIDMADGTTKPVLTVTWTAAATGYPSTLAFLGTG